MKINPKFFCKIVILLLMCTPVILNAQSQSSIDIGMGTGIEAGTGTDICADLQSGAGELTGEGTWCDGVLPVELQSFTAATNGNNVQLSWTTSMEINNDGFEIQRTPLENANWVFVGFVKGAVNSSSSQTYSFTDTEIPSGAYRYRLKQIDFNGSFEYFELSESVSIGVPEKFRLEQNFPNPFNPSTHIAFELPEDCVVRIMIYDMSGREIMTLINRTFSPGRHRIEFRGEGLSSGTYLYKVEATGRNSSFTAVKRMLLMK